MARRKRQSVCSVAGCPTLSDSSRCEEHRRAAEQQRGSAAERGYSGKAWRLARRAVLTRDPICVVCKKAFATVADHWPKSRRELVAEGVRNPNALQYLRALCASCHSRETATNPEQAGGWNKRD